VQVESSLSSLFVQQILTTIIPKKCSLWVTHNGFSVFLNYANIMAQFAKWIPEAVAIARKLMPFVARWPLLCTRYRHPPSRYYKPRTRRVRIPNLESRNCAADLYRK
jgi:hypothetical protein